MQLFWILIFIRLFHYPVQGILTSYMIEPRKSRLKSVILYGVILFVPNAATALLMNQINPVLSMIIIYSAYLAAFAVCFKGKLGKKLIAFVVLVALEMLNETITWLLCFVVLQMPLIDSTKLFEAVEPSMFIYALVALSTEIVTSSVFLMITGKKRINIESKTVIAAILVFGVQILGSATTFLRLIQNNVMYIDSIILNIFTSVFTMIFIFMIARSNKSFYDLKYKSQYLLELNNEMKRHSIELQEQNKKLAALRHDFKLHTNVLSRLLDEGEDEKARQYLSEFTDKFSFSQLYFSGISSVDAVISAKFGMAEKLGIDIEVLIEKDCLDGIDEIDLCTIFANLLTNATEACERFSEEYPEEKQSIRLSAAKAMDNLIIAQSNTAVKPDDKLLTSKKNPELHGFGLSIIKSVADKYSGNVVFEFKESKLYSTVRLCLSSIASVKQKV